MTGTAAGLRLPNEHLKGHPTPLDLVGRPVDSARAPLGTLRANARRDAPLHRSEPGFAAPYRGAIRPWRIGAGTAAALVLLHHEHAHTT